MCLTCGLISRLRLRARLPEEMIRLDRGSVLSFAAGDKVLMKLFIIINRMKLTPSLFADQQGRVSRRDQQVVYDKAVVGRASRQGAQRPRLDR